MRKLRLTLPLFVLFVLTGCQTMQAYDCALGGCAAVNAQKRQVLQNEQQRGAQLRTEQANVQSTQKSVRGELNTAQKEYDALSADIKGMKDALAKAGKQNSEAAAELDSLQRDINLRRSTMSSSSSEDHQKELAALREREAKLKAQVKALLAN